jgi:calcineurin-like phosphoesterase family protein
MPHYKSEVLTRCWHFSPKNRDTMKTILTQTLIEGYRKYPTIQKNENQLIISHSDA